MPPVSKDEYGNEDRSVMAGRAARPGDSNGARAHSHHLSVSCLHFVHWPPLPRTLRVLGTMTAEVLESPPFTSCTSPQIPGRDSGWLSLAHVPIPGAISGIVGTWVTWLVGRVVVFGSRNHVERRRLEQMAAVLSHSASLGASVAPTFGQQTDAVLSPPDPGVGGPDLLPQ